MAWSVWLLLLHMGIGPQASPFADPSSIPTQVDIITIGAESSNNAQTLISLHFADKSTLVYDLAYPQDGMLNLIHFYPRSFKQGCQKV